MTIPYRFEPDTSAAAVHEEFDGGHMNVQYRYDRSFVLLCRALARR